MGSNALTTAWRLPVAVGLAAITIALLGYAAYSVQAKQTEIDVLTAELGELRGESYAKEARIFNTLLSPDSLNLMDSMVQEPDAEKRRALVFEITRPVFEDPVPYAAGEEIWARLDMLAQAQDQAERQDIRDRLEQKIFDMTPPPPEVAIFGLDEARSISTLVTAVLGLGSGLGSLFVFLTGGSRRKIEEEMLSLDLEKSRIELAKLRFEAREALEHQQT